MTLEKNTFNLTGRAARALDRRTAVEDVNKTDIVNRALIFYAMVMEKMAAEDTDEITIGSKTIGVFL